MLEGANIKLGFVVSDVMGVSAKDMLNAIAEGEEDPEKLANFVRRTNVPFHEERSLPYIRKAHDC